MSALKRILVEDKRSVLSSYSGMALEELVSLLTRKLNELPADQQASARFSVEKFYEPYEEEPSVELRMSFKRPETDKELAERQRRYNEQIALQAEHDRREYERLSKIFKS